MSGSSNTFAQQVATEPVLIGDIPPTVYLLADHLDAVLAAGEDLLKLSVTVEDPGKADGATPVWTELRDLVTQASELEGGLVARILQARSRARDIGDFDDEMKPVLTLFNAGTALLVDAAADLTDTDQSDFDSGTDPLVYLRSRGVIPADAGSLHAAGPVRITEDFLAARAMPLGGLLDLAAQLLDVLDANYGLFEDEAEALGTVETVQTEAGDVAAALSPAGDSVLLAALSSSSR
jgi:hypothetical protein